MPSGRKAELVLGANNRRLRRDLRVATRDLHTFGRNAGRRVRTGFSASIGSLATLGSVAGLAAVGKDVLQVETGLTRMGIQAGKTEADLGRFSERFGQSAADIGLAFGMSKESVTGAASALVDLMGAEAATIDNMRLLARASSATGAATKDLAGTYYALDNAFKFKNARDAEKALSGVIEAGKQGSIPLAQMSSVLQQQATSLAKLTNNAGDAAAMLQIVRRGFGSAAEAGTGVKALVNTFEGSADKLKALGIRVYAKVDGKRVLRDLDDILDQVEKKNLLNHRSFTWAMGSAEARKALEMLVAHRDKYNEIREAARQSNAVQEDSAKFLNSNAGRMQRAMAKVRHEVESLFTPKRLGQFTRAATLLAKAVGLAVDHLDDLVAIVGTVYSLRFAATMFQWTNSLMAFNTGITAASAGLGNLTSQTGKLGKLTAGLGALGAVAATAAAGWTVGSMVADYLGVGTDDSAKTRAEADRRNLTAKRARLGRSDQVVESLASGQYIDPRRFDRVLSRRERDELRAIAGRVQDGTASVADRQTLAARSKGAYLFREDTVRNNDGSARYVSDRDVRQEIARLELEVARHDAIARNETRLATWNDESAVSDVARGFLQSEFQGGDKRVTWDEIHDQLSQKGLLTDLVLRSDETTEMSVNKQVQANQMLIEKMAELIEMQKQQYGNLGETIQVDLSLEGHKIIEATANTQHAARSPAE